MIRMIQKQLIIPRGDTGTFSIPILASSSSDQDASIFTIFDPLNHKKIFQKVMEEKDGVLSMNFTHADTVNLPIGQFVWDIKFYKNVEIVDGVFLNGTEIDSYYAAFKLPICEIRQTGDALLTADDAPTSTVLPDQLNVILAATSEIRDAKDAVERDATIAAEAADDAVNAATSAENSASAAEDVLEEMRDLIPTVPTRISDLIDDSGHYIKPIAGIPATDLAETYLTASDLPQYATDAETQALITEWR